MSSATGASLSIRPVRSDFGSTGSIRFDRSAAVLPIRARMFLLTADRLAVVDGTSAGDLLTATSPVSREIKLPAPRARVLLQQLAALARQ